MTWTPEHHRMYSSEKEENFRWTLKLSGTRSSYLLTANDATPPELQRELSDIGQFAEVAHGSMDPQRVWRFLPQLLESGSPLHGYDFLEGSELVERFLGWKSHLQGYVAYRPSSKQLVVALSGTSSIMQAVQDLKTWKRTWPCTEVGCKGAAAHAGFYSLYLGIKHEAFRVLADGIRRHDVSKIIFTGHSMGGAVSYLLLLDLLRPAQQSLRLPFGVALQIVVFGAPRAANDTLVRCWKNRVNAYRDLHGEQSFCEHSVKSFNDGVPALPPSSFGFRHFDDNPFYLYQGTLYKIPTSEKEHSIFDVEESSLTDKQIVPPDFPLGGHNYYGGRDMEKLQRLMRWATELGLGRDEGWKEAFLQKQREEDERWQVKWKRRSAGRLHALIPWS